jgi:uncharacterized membrane protein
VLVPAALAVALYAAMWFVVDPDYANQMAYAAGFSIFGFGTTVILGGAVMGDDGFSRLGTWDLSFLALFLGTTLAFVYVYSLDLFEKLPRVGPALRKSRADAVLTVQDRPWIRRWATIGVGLFVLSPLPGSGALGGALVGRLVGLSRVRTFLSVTIANALVCLLYAWFSTGIREWVKDHEPSPLQKIAGLLVVALLFWGLVTWVRSLSRGPRPALPTQPGGSGPA